MIKPDRLSKGDKIAIISPASAVKGEFIDRACEYLEEYGLEPVVMPHAKGPSDGSYSATFTARFEDFVNSWSDTEIKAILCGRGGYGATHILPDLPTDLFSNNPKWLIGFSDISALHAAITAQGVMSVHGPMTRHFNPGDSGVEQIMRLLIKDEFPVYKFTRTGFEVMPENRPGKAVGRLYGGNLAVLNGLAATPYDMLNRPKEGDAILFIEDIAEPIYKVERVLYRLLMQGIFENLKGLIVGQFTEYKPSADHLSMEIMIEKFLSDHKLNHFPVSYHFPVGHIEGNMPLVEGARTEMEVGPLTVEINQIP